MIKAKLTIWTIDEVPTALKRGQQSKILILNNI